MTENNTYTHISLENSHFLQLLTFSRLVIKMDQRQDRNLDCCGMCWNANPELLQCIISPSDFPSAFKGFIGLMGTQAAHLNPPWLLSWFTSPVGHHCLNTLPLVSVFDSSFLSIPVFAILLWTLISSHWGGLSSLCLPMGCPWPNFSQAPLHSLLNSSSFWASAFTSELPSFSKNIGKSV